MPKQIRGVTLPELIIALVLISVVVMGIFSIDLFSRYQVSTSDRRAKVQNEVSYVLEHMSKQVARAIGNLQIDGADNVTYLWDPSSGKYRKISVYIDASRNGTREPENSAPNQDVDHWIAYFFDSAANIVNYCSLCTENPQRECNNCPGWETLSNKIIDFDPIKPVFPPNIIEMNITACWNTTAINTCGSPDNPSVTMRSRIWLPGVSSN
jgi:prepilin-type N-terminal cleavage/methylation domain-containing protein